MRKMLRLLSSLGLSTAIVIGYGGRLLNAQNDPNAAPNPYRMEEFRVQLPDDRKLGAPIGVEIDHSDGKTLWIYERCGGDSCAGSTVDPVMKLDASEKWSRISAAVSSIGRMASTSIGPAMCGSQMGAVKTEKAKPSSSFHRRARSC